MRHFRGLGLALFVQAAALTVLSQSALAQASDASGQTTFALGVGWEHLRVGSVQFGGTYNETLATSPLVSTNEQQDGNFNGVRTDASLGAPASSFGLPDGIVSLRGFYAWHQASTNLDCHSVSKSATCDGVPLFDPGTGNHTLGTFGAGETAAYATDRTVQHWGVALETEPNSLRIAGLSNRLGIGYRAIDQDMSLTSTWSQSTNRQHYDETLDTGYLGAYWGMSGRHPLSHGLDLVYAGDAGIYWAHTSYDGALSQSDFLGSLSQGLSLDRDEAAFIGALSLGVEQQFSCFTLAGYARGEYYSYAPQMAYNQTERTSGILTGRNDGTRIDSTDAWDVTVGAGVSVPLGSPLP
jgi:hypothetical protein